VECFVNLDLGQPARAMRRAQAVGLQQKFLVTLVAVLCHVLQAGACVEEIVADSSKSDIAFQNCMIRRADRRGEMDVRASGLPCRLGAPAP
jgi:hypothetical protein